MSAQGSSRIFFYACWPLAILVGVYVLIVIYAYRHDHEAHLSAVMVAKIDAQKLTADDVDGRHVPPPPDPEKVNETIAGIDANDNGIRDDVELAIFARYPTSTSIRTAELQYAMSEQMYLTDVFDRRTWQAVTEQDARAYSCIGATDASADLEEHLQIVEQRGNEVEQLVFNTDERRQKEADINSQYETSFGIPNDPACDVDPDSIRGQ
jgi:hypothetical protein